MDLFHAAETFGRHYLERGELRTKYIKTTDVGAAIRVFGQVRSRDELAGGTTRIELDVWIEGADGTKLTVGDAAVDIVPEP